MATAVPEVQGDRGAEAPAKKIEVEVRPPVGTPSGGGRVRWHLPEEPPSSSEVIGEGPEAAPAVVDLLERLGVLR